MTSMIRPVRSGEQLLDEIARARPADGAVDVWWLGQSGYVLASGAGILVIDPYLSEHLTAKYAGTSRPHIRMTEAPFRGSDLRCADLVLASHKHSDHLDPGTLPDLLAASRRAVLGLPASLLEHAASLGLPTGRLAGLRAGDVIERAGFRIRAVPSAHEGLDTDEQGRHLYLGFVIEVNGRRLYHSGDTLAYDGLIDALGPEPFDALFLPINGGGKGVPANMTAADAVALAARVRPRHVVPHHYDMFTFNTVPVADFLAEARALPEGVLPRVLNCGERWEVRP